MLQPTNSYNISILATIQLSNAKESRPTLQSEVPSVSKLHRLSRASYKGFQNGKGGHESMKQHTRYSCELCLFKKGKKNTYTVGGSTDVELFEETQVRGFLVCPADGTQKVSLYLHRVLIKE
jgi:ribosome modulation factor